MKNQRVVSNIEILNGKPTIKGTRISIEFILDLLSSGWLYEQIIKDYKLTKEDIFSALDYAKTTLEEVKTVPLSRLNDTSGW